MSPLIALICTIVVAHFVADFVCQSDWMALNKSTRWDALLLHVGVYSLVTVLMMGTLTTHGLVLWGVVNALAHFFQDAITSRVNARLWQANQRHWFFVGIGADQCLHYLTLFVTADWWLI